LVRAADQVEHRENGMIRVAMTYRLCSPPRFETVSPLKSGCFVRLALCDRILSPPFLSAITRFGRMEPSKEPIFTDLEKFRVG
jgi:hypothetical protein